MKDRTIGVHPELIARVQKVLAAMAALGFPMMITDGVRTTAMQQTLYLQGRGAPGSIVTYADGVKAKSNHQSKSDGYGHAVDCCFLINGIPSWDAKLPWALYGSLGKFLGLAWGGDWPKPKTDKPHMELGV